MTAASTSPPPARVALSSEAIRQLTMPAMLAVIWILFALLAPQFLSPRNLSMLMIELSVTATLAVGVLLVLLPGHTDLSVGAGAGLLGGIASVLIFKHGWPAPPALALSLVVGLALYAGMGWFIVTNRIQAFIITLGGMLAFKGAFWLVIQSTTIPVVRGGEQNLYSRLTTFYLPPTIGLILAAAVIAVLVISTIRGRRRRQSVNARVPSFEVAYLKTFVAAQAILLVVLVCNQYQGVPLAFVILCTVAAAVHVLTQHTPFGRYLYAIGGNEEAAVVSGVPTARVVIIAFTLLGGIVAITGFMATAYAGASTTTVGDLMELDAIAACVIGGTSLKGGRGSVLGALFGALIMASLLNGMTLMAVSPELKFIVRGLVLAFAVWMDVRLGRR
ncbi:MAG TPA: ATPase [Verrucomicrobiota bacterium]|nr:ATPase [Verrucomicrobiota bacterium]